MTNSLDIIIVNWNGGTLLQDCVKSVLQSDLSGIILTIFISDNGSTDNSLEILPPDPRIRILENKANFGFGKACNIAYEHCTAEYILLLNPDCEVYQASLASSIAFMNDRREIGVLGVKQLDREGHVLRGAARSPKPIHFINHILGLNNISSRLFPQMIMHDWDHLDSREVDHVIGSFMLIRKQIIEEIGFMDERYFVYLEDLDLSMRVKKAGYRIFYNADIQVMHEGGGLSKQVKARRLFYSIHSKILFVKKYYNAFMASLIILLTLFIEPLIRILYALLKFDLKGVKETISAYTLLHKEIRLHGLTGRKM